MKIDEAIYILKELENNNSLWKSEIQAIYTVLNERECLLKEVSNLARESVEREKEVARLERDILAWQLYYTKESGDNE